MAGEGKLNQQKSKGDRAKRERGYPLVDEFFQQAKDACHKVWQDTAPEDASVRERAWMHLQALESLEMCFRKTVTDGQFASEKLARLIEEKKK